MPPAKEIGLAVVGAGPIGLRHLQAIAEVPACRAVAVVDPAPVGAETAKAWGLPHFHDLETMFEVIAPDGVINATPNAQHVPISLTAIGRGIPVLVEKPIADHLAAAFSLADAAEAAGVPVLVGHHRRHNPIVAKARELVWSGAIGGLTAVSATWLAYKPEDYYDVAWRRQPGGGPILINLIHDIDNLRYIAGEIVAVQGMTANRQRGLEVEDTAAILLRFENGALGSVVLSDKAASPWSWELTSGERTSYSFPLVKQDCYRLAGTEGSLAIPSLQLWRYDGAPDWRAPLTTDAHPVEADDPARLQIEHFADVIRGGTAPLITARDAARTLAVTLAVSEAATTGSEVIIRTS